MNSDILHKIRLKKAQIPTITAIIFMVLSTVSLFGQNDKRSHDSTRAESILKKASVSIPNNSVVNKNGYYLDLSKRQCMRIANKAVNKTYGILRMLIQKPFHKINIEGYWVIWGDFKRKNKRRGGVFECIVNPRNGCVEHLVHGK